MIALADFAPSIIRSFPYFDNSPKTIALTIDDGPDALVTPKLLDLLSQYNIKATFFLVGKNIVDNPDIVKRMVAEGHVIGNHTFTHRQFLSKLNMDGTKKCWKNDDGSTKCDGTKSDGKSLICDSGDIVKKEILSTDALLQKYVSPAQKRLYYRPPGGGWCFNDVNYSGILNEYFLKNPSLKTYAGPVYWQMGGEIDYDSNKNIIDAGDEECWTEGVSVDQCLKGYIAAIQRKEDNGHGGILLNHDVHMHSVELLSKLIPKLVEKGYRFITLDEDPDFDDPHYGFKK